MLKRLFLYLVLCSVTLIANEPYSIYKDNDDIFAKIDGIEPPVKLHIGAGMPHNFEEKAWAEAEITIKVLKDFDKDRVMNIRAIEF